MSNILREMTDTLSELLRMHKLNMELLEVLHVSLNRIRKFERAHNIPLDLETECLLSRVVVLYEELTSKQKCNKLPFIPELSDERKQRKRSDAEEPVPVFINFISIIFHKSS